MQNKTVQWLKFISGKICNKINKKKPNFKQNIPKDTEGLKRLNKFQ